MFTMFRVVALLGTLPPLTRNFLYEPTAYAWPLVLCYVALLFTTLSLPLVSARWRLVFAAILLTIIALLVQIRNPDWPSVGFLPGITAIFATAMARGTLYAGLVSFVYAACSLVVMLVVQRISPANAMVLISGFVLISTAPITLVVMLLVNRDADYVALVSSEQQLQREEVRREQLLTLLSDELSMPLDALRRLPDISGDPQAVIAAMGQAGDDVADIIEDLKQNLVPRNSDHFNAKRVNINNLAESIRRQLQPALAGRGVALDVEFTHTPATSYRIDGSRLRFVLTHLIRNSQLHPDATRLVLRVSGRRDSDNAHSLIFCVECDGTGLPIRDEARLFDGGVFRPHLAVSDGPSRLGDFAELSRCAELLASMSGRLSYSFTTQGKPSYEALVKASPSSWEDDTSGTDTRSNLPLARCRIAVVDDDPVVAGICEQLLVASGSASVAIFSTREAVSTSTLMGRQFDLVFFDASSYGAGSEQLVVKIGEAVGTTRLIAMHPLPEGLMLSADVAATTERPLNAAGLSRALRSMGLQGDTDTAMPMSYR